MSNEVSNRDKEIAAIVQALQAPEALAAPALDALASALQVMNTALEAKDKLRDEVRQLQQRMAK